MKKIILSMTAVMCILSCSKENESSGLEIEFGNLEVKEVRAADVNALDEINAYAKVLTSTNALTQEESDFINSRIEIIKEEVSLSTYKKIYITYPSVDAQGNAAMLTGVIYMPRQHGDFDEILLYCHQTATGNEDVPGGNGTFCLEPLVVSTSTSTVCFASDYVGFNASAEYNHPYMNNALAARNELDMMKAGLVYLKNKGYKVKSAAQGLETYAFGYSQGGGVALALHRLLEENKQLCEDINFCGSLCGDGPYNLETTFQKFIKDGTMAMPIVLPYVLLGMYESYPWDFGGIDIYDYMSEKCEEAEVIEYIESKPTIVEALLWMKKNIGNDISDIMSEEAMDPGSDIMTVLFKALERQNLTDGSWTPAHPVTIYHSKKDNVVSFSNAQEALDRFPPNVCHRSPLDADQNHIIEYMNFASLCIEKGIPGMMKY